MSCNGWKNYETWAIKLWMNNEESSYHAGRAMAIDAWEQTDDERDIEKRCFVARCNLADSLKYEYEEAIPELDGVWADLLRAALGEVDWFEIANSMLEDEELEGYVSR